LLAAAPRNISAILFAVRRFLLAAICLGVVCASVILAKQLTPAPPTRIGPVVVLDPAHGGTDTGARGAGGAVEKDVVLNFARIAKLELERQGFRVVMTRSDDSNPSYDDRAAIANANRDAVFISLHLASTGSSGIARVYSYRFSAPASASPSSNGLIPWDEAQQPYTEASHRLADILQVELAQRFTGSPAISTAFPVRELRSIAAPAVAIEISSVSVPDPNSLTAFAPPLVSSIARGLTVYRPASSVGAP
jgi:N-acetylmuramoyl-L-alanine amidase